ncbi:hypothetical protein [uncultured Megasphaera sp.]|nr:hypothetical protein [uncultured Megasphaera sp.]
MPAKSLFWITIQRHKLKKSRHRATNTMTGSAGGTTNTGPVM